MAKTREHHWRTDGASGTIEASSAEDALQRLIADGEWPEDDEAVIADGGFLVISAPDMGDRPIVRGQPW